MANPKKSKLTRSKQPRRILRLVVVVCIIVVLIWSMGSLLIPFFLNLLGKITADASTSDTTNLLSDGLAIIGMAISVWATLNIISVLDKEDVENLRRELIELREEQEELATKQNYNILRKEFESCSSDHIMKYLATKIDEFDENYYPQMTIVLQYYSRVNELSAQRQYNELLEFAATEGINYIDDLLYNNKLCHAFHSQTDKFVQFLHFCKGELLFYKGYCYEKSGHGQDGYNCSLQSLEEYNQCKNLLDIPHANTFSYYVKHSIDAYNYTDCANAVKKKVADEEKAAAEKKTVDEEKAAAEKAKSILEQKHNAAYWSNTFGENYNKIVRSYKYWTADEKAKKKLEEYKNLAVYYCIRAVEFSDYNNPTYLRNLGCALEAVYDIPNCAQEQLFLIKSIYQDALDLATNSKNDIPHKLFYVILSLNHKYSNSKIKNWTPELNNYTWLQKDPEKNSDDAIHYTATSLKHAQMAAAMYPQDLVFQKFHALALRDACIWEILCNGVSDTAKAYYQQLCEKADLLNVFCPQKKDQFLTEINAFQNSMRARM